MIVNFYNQGRR